MFVQIFPCNTLIIIDAILKRKAHRFTSTRLTINLFTFQICKIEKNTKT